MAEISEPARWEAELHALRQELSELRNEQKELARTIAQLVQTFQALATHMGIASEPYTKKAASSAKDLSGFA